MVFTGIFTEGLTTFFLILIFSGFELPVIRARKPFFRTEGEFFACEEPIYIKNKHIHIKTKTLKQQWIWIRCQGFLIPFFSGTSSKVAFELLERNDIMLYYHPKRYIDHLLKGM